MKYNPNDKYARRAKEMGYRARSVFKLEAIQERFHLLKPGMKVLDLGCAPGSFLQYISTQIGERGLAVGLDLQKVEKLGLLNVQVFQGDIFNEVGLAEVCEKLGVTHYDLVTSDLAPKTTGIKSVDGNASLELNLQVLEIAKKHLKKGGNVIMKILSGFNEGDLVGEARKMFRQVRKFRPEAIRKSSHESYLIGFNKAWI